MLGAVGGRGSGTAGTSAVLSPQSYGADRDEHYPSGVKRGRAPPGYLCHSSKCMAGAHMAQLSEGRCGEAFKRWHWSWTSNIELDSELELL